MIRTVVRDRYLIDEKTPSEPITEVIGGVLRCHEETMHSDKWIIRPCSRSTSTRCTARRSADIRGLAWRNRAWRWRESLDWPQCWSPFHAWNPGSAVCTTKR